MCAMKTKFRDIWVLILKAIKNYCLKLSLSIVK